jgi:hypothetical protein
MNCNTRVSIGSEMGELGQREKVNSEDTPINGDSTMVNGSFIAARFIMNEMVHRTDEKKQ